MGQHVCFKTPGLIPIEAFTMMGINVKPNTKNPIGHFGTGLKYAIAILLRYNASIVLWIGLTKYEFFSTTIDFRGTRFDKIRMVRTTHGNMLEIIRKKTFDLPFTTEFGKNWELWMAFREIESNTRDENGSTFLVSDIPIEQQKLVSKDTTLFIIGDPRFTQIYHERDKYFLPQGLTVMAEDASLQIIERPSKYVYFRGLLVHELKEPAKYTYNILQEVTLTEDRTVKYPHVIDQIIASHVMKSEDKVVVNTIVNARKGYEAKLDYDYIYVSPSPVFLQTTSRSSVASPGAVKAAKPYLPKKVVADPFEKWPRPWRVQNGFIYDANDKCLLRIHSPNVEEGVEDLVIAAVAQYKPQPKEETE